MNSEICIIGGGAVGGVLAYYLYKSGVDYIPVYYSNIDSVKEVSRNKGINVVDRVHGFEVVVPITPRWIQNPIDKCRFIFNAVKAYQVPSTLASMKKLLEPGGVVLMLQNGFDSLELVEEQVVHGKVAGGVVYYGAERISPTTIAYTGGNTIIAGCRKTICPEIIELSRLLRLGGLDFRYTNDIDYYRWLKLALNSVVNSITAITSSKNKIVLEVEAQELARQILIEFIEAARLKGYNFELDKLLEYINRNVRIVAENTSSMLQDLTRGSKTEIDYLNGYIVSLLGEKAPVNKAITLLVKLLEKTRQSRH